METTVIKINGTHCKACKLLIEDVCKDMEGVKSCNVEFETGRTVIEHDKDFSIISFKKEVEDLGQYKMEINQ